MESGVIVVIILFMILLAIVIVTTCVVYIIHYKKARKMGMTKSGANKYALLKRWFVKNDREMNSEVWDKLKQEHNIIDADFENFLKNELKSYGYLFPTTDEQMSTFEENMEDIPLPKELESPDYILNQFKHIKT